MSNLYIQEPPTNGKVLLVTSVGDIDIELWSKEAPKACRNFVQLCIEGYYDQTIFHRIVKGFIIQGGDPTGTGTGGESIYGKPFKDEFHQRLRFNRRGLLGMANAGPNDNKSQFFFTLDRAEELDKKHTIFGKISGNTIYNMLRMVDIELDENDRPIDPPKILQTEILSNPYDDIEPREVRKKEGKLKDTKNKSKSKATKNFKLLSFGEEAEEDEEEVTNVTKTITIKSSHDVLDDPKLSSETAIELISTASGKGQCTSDIQERIRDKLKKSAESRKRQPSPDSEDDEQKKKNKRRKALRDEAKQLKRELVDDDSKCEDQKAPQEEAVNEDQPPSNSLMEELKAERKDFLKTKNKSALLKRNTREQETLALLGGFKGILQDHPLDSSDTEKEKDTEDDRGWMSHKFVSEEHSVNVKDANIKDDDTFDIYDPRNPLNKRKREKSKQTQSVRKWEKNSNLM